jgi:hypothetical protein
MHGMSRRGVLGLIAALPVAARAVGVAQPVRSTLTAENGRAVPLWHWPAQGRRVGTIAFSHGAASAPWKYPGVFDVWAAAGFDVYAPLHVDSTDHPHRADFKGLAGWAARLQDMSAVSRMIGHDYIAVGHSFGGLNALVLGGVSAIVPPGVPAPLRDVRATRVVAFSPPQPLAPLIDTAGYATLAVPALIETGTRDIPPGHTEPDGWRAHLTAYDAAAAGGHRYAVVLDGVDHYFGGAICDFTRPGPRLDAPLKRAVDLALTFMTAPQHGGRPDFRALDAQLSETGPMRLMTK